MATAVLEPHVEHYLTLRIERYELEDRGLPAVRIFRNNGINPVAHHWFPTFERREMFIIQEKEKISAWEAQKADRKADRLAVVNPYKLGDILSASWGYEQTNIDFYQVVGLRAKSVLIRQLQQEIQEDPHGAMAGWTVPVPNQFVESSPIKLCRVNDRSAVKVRKWGVWADKWDGTRESCSWYA